MIDPSTASSEMPSQNLPPLGQNIQVPTFVHDSPSYDSKFPDMRDRDTGRSQRIAPSGWVEGDAVVSVPQSMPQAIYSHPLANSSNWSQPANQQSWTQQPQWQPQQQAPLTMQSPQMQNFMMQQMMSNYGGASRAMDRQEMELAKEARGSKGRSAIAAFMMGMNPTLGRLPAEGLMQRNQDNRRDQMQIAQNRMALGNQFFNMQQQSDPNSPARQIAMMNAQANMDRAQYYGQQTGNQFQLGQGNLQQKQAEMLQNKAIADQNYQLGIGGLQQQFQRNQISREELDQRSKQMYLNHQDNLAQLANQMAISNNGLAGSVYGANLGYNQAINQQNQAAQIAAGEQVFNPKTGKLEYKLSDAGAAGLGYPRPQDAPQLNPLQQMAQWFNGQQTNAQPIAQPPVSPTGLSLPINPATGKHFTPEEVGMSMP